MERAEQLFYLLEHRGGQERDVCRALVVFFKKPRSLRLKCSCGHVIFATGNARAVWQLTEITRL